MEAVFTDFDVQAVKIGMLYNKETIDAVKLGIKKFQLKNIVLDPVMISKSGCALLKPELITYIKKILFPAAKLITPNLLEAESILKIKISNADDMEVAASQMGKEFQTNILLKGGHLNIPEANDILYSYKENEFRWFYADRIQTKNTHGTGCTLSSAIASFLAQDYSLLEAITEGKQYLSKAILYGSNLNLGKGHGPVQHFY